LFQTPTAERWRLHAAGVGALVTSGVLPMIIVLKQATGCCCAKCGPDGVTLWGHASIAFTAYKNGFAISQMNDANSFPTYHNDEGFQPPKRNKDLPGMAPNSDWRRTFLAVRQKDNASFRHIFDAAYILSQEDLSEVNQPKDTAPSEMAAYDWWMKLSQNVPDMSHALGSADCSDTVYKALEIAGAGTWAPQRAFNRAFMTPQSAVNYARAIQAKVARYFALNQTEIENIIYSDDLWKAVVGWQGGVKKETDKAPLIE
jgi:hypothetical protein